VHPEHFDDHLGDLCTCGHIYDDHHMITGECEIDGCNCDRFTDA
jgi:hypothetical protein